MIKNLKPSGKYKSGNYEPLHPEKYKGTFPIIYRSSWEFRICRYCDLNKKVAYWASEPFEIPYFSPLDNKIHRYYPDFYFVINKMDGSQKKYVVEVKPYSKIIPPKKVKTNSIKAIERYNLALKEYLVIIAKSRAAKKWCSERNIKYIFATDKDWDKLFK